MIDAKKETKTEEGSGRTSETPSVQTPEKTPEKPVEEKKKVKVNAMHLLNQVQSLSIALQAVDGEGKL